MDTGKCCDLFIGQTDSFSCHFAPQSFEGVLKIRVFFGKAFFGFGAINCP
jgi:hypothetical protein